MTEGGPFELLSDGGWCRASRSEFSYLCTWCTPLPEPCSIRLHRRYPLYVRHFWFSIWCRRLLDVSKVTEGGSQNCLWIAESDVSSDSKPSSFVYIMSSFSKPTSFVSQPYPRTGYPFAGFPPMGRPLTRYPMTNRLSCSLCAYWSMCLLCYWS